MAADEEGSRVALRIAAHARAVERLVDKISREVRQVSEPRSGDNSKKDGRVHDLIAWLAWLALLLALVWLRKNR